MINNPITVYLESFLQETKRLILLLLHLCTFRYCWSQFLNKEGKNFKITHKLKQMKIHLYKHRSEAQNDIIHVTQ